MNSGRVNMKISTELPVPSLSAGARSFLALQLTLSVLWAVDVPAVSRVRLRSEGQTVQDCPVCAGNDCPFTVHSNVVPAGNEPAPGFAVNVMPADRLDSAYTGGVADVSLPAA